MPRTRFSARSSRRRRSWPRRLRSPIPSRKTMALQDKTLKLCSCNGTAALDAKALGAALKAGAPLKVHTELCRREAGAFQGALGDPEVLVACTQEAALFGELAQGAGSKAELGFVNIRQTPAL